MADTLLLILALIGHVGLWVTLYNQIHSRAIPRWTIRATNVSIYIALVAVPVLLGRWYLAGGGPLSSRLLHRPPLPALYLGICACGGVLIIIDWIAHVRRPPSGMQRSNHTTHSDLLRELGPRYDGPKWVQRLARLPGNQLLELSIHEKELEIPRLPAELDGLVIAHLSDLHYTGHVGRAWFEEVIRRTEALGADLIAVTGDLIDRQQTFSWIPSTLARLRAEYGAYFILGNHDLKVDHRRLRQLLIDSGLTDLGSRWQLVKIRGRGVVLAGNELPWFSPAAEMEHAPTHEPGDRLLRILLSHSPDQYGWARRNDFDLMMAGHTHGGQFRLPLIGPVVTSSLIGSHFAAGTYYREPTVMHVSRGLSSTVLMRLNCPPELTRLVLRRPRGDGPRRGQ